MMIVLRVYDAAGTLRQTSSVPIDCELGFDVLRNIDSSAPFKVQMTIATENQLANIEIPPAVVQ